MDEYDVGVEDIDPSERKRLREVEGPDEPIPPASIKKNAKQERRERLREAGLEYEFLSSDEENESDRELRLEEYRIRLEEEEPSSEHLMTTKKMNAIFEDLKKDEGYARQHWHFTEAEDEERQWLPLEYDRGFWDWNMSFYGDKSHLVPNTLQIYSLKLITEGDDYSLDVYGELYLHCSVGFGPQRLFYRDRNHCQTITKQDPYLLLTGPYGHPTAPPLNRVFIEAFLTVKGTTEPEDRDLRVFAKCDEEKSAGNTYNFTVPKSAIYSVDPDHQSHVFECCKNKCKPCMCTSKKTGKHYLLEMTRSIVTGSIVANIYVKPVGELLTGCYFFTAYTGESPSDDMKVVLLDCRDGKVPRCHGDGSFVLSRQTICVDRRVGTLKVYIEHDKNGEELTFNHGDGRIEDEKTKEVSIGLMSMKVTVQWWCGILKVKSILSMHLLELYYVASQRGCSKVTTVMASFKMREVIFWQDWPLFLVLVCLLQLVVPPLLSLVHANCVTEEMRATPVNTLNPQKTAMIVADLLKEGRIANPADLRYQEDLLLPGRLIEEAGNLGRALHKVVKTSK